MIMARAVIKNWPKTREAGFDRGLKRVPVACEALRGKCHHENTVRRRDTHAHDCAHQRGHTERGVCEKQEDDNAG
jgi:hypothetical protein